MSTAILALEDGTIFWGDSFGAAPPTSGEICFNTAMTGYQEVITDPSYKGQIVAMTCPHIGNTGINGTDTESLCPQVSGFVVEELSPIVSNWRSEGDLAGWLAQHGVVAIQGIDTRTLTRRLRTRGAMRAAIVEAAAGPDAAVATARGAQYEGVDFVSKVTTGAPFHWDLPGGTSGRWVPMDPRQANTRSDTMGNHFLAAPPAGARVVALDFGVKTNILRCLRRDGLDVEVVPAGTPPESILEKNPEGIFLSNGPGDPAALEAARSTVAALVGRAPIFGICLGHQLLAMALGARTFKLKFGHRGANHPVKDLRTGRVTITSQNHGYAVDPESLPEDVEITHINLNDNTVAGLRHKRHAAFSVQYHPEASPGPHDADYFFGEFAKAIAARRQN